MPHFVDRLLDQISQKGAPICVGIDPVLEKLPDSERNNADPLPAIESFCSQVLDLVAEQTPIVKFQSACFERYFAPGLDCLQRLITKAQSLNIMVILDAKRGDIGSSAAHYAAGCLASAENYLGPDALTVNGYFGLDGLKPFLDVCAQQGKGLFALVRTSNPGGDPIQGQILQDGRTVAEAMAQLMTDIGNQPGYLGKSGYSALGAVVGATKSEDAVKLRQIMPRQLFLVPGYGAQGAGADDVRACFKPDGTGALITASRSITYAFNDTTTKNWQSPIQQAVKDMHADILNILNG